MRNSNLFWGGVLILLGVLLLFGWMEYFWPIALILLGGWILFGALMRGSSKTEHLSADLKGAREVSLRVNHGAGQLRIGGDASMGMAVEGDCSGGASISSSLSGERLEVRVSSDVVFFPFIGSTRGLDWNLRLTNEVPLSLTVESGANQSFIDLRNLRVTSVNLKTGASSTDVTMPAAGIVVASIQMGAAEMTVHIPPGVAGRIRSRSGLADIQIDRVRFPSMNDAYESPDFATSPNRVDLLIEAGVGKVTVS